MNKPLTYSLEVHRLDSTYDASKDFPNSTSLISFGSDTPVGCFSVGDTITDGPNIDFLGIVAHVNHMVGEFGPDENRHVTRVYINPED